MLSRISCNYVSTAFKGRAPSATRLQSKHSSVPQRDLFVMRADPTHHVAMYTLGRLTSVKGMPLQDFRGVNSLPKQVILRFPLLQKVIHVDMKVRENAPNWTFNIINRHDSGELKICLSARVRFAFVDVEKAIGHCNGADEGHRHLSSLQSLIMVKAAEATRKELSDYYGIKNLLHMTETVDVKEANKFLEKHGVKLLQVAFWCQSMSIDSEPVVLDPSQRYFKHIENNPALKDFSW